MKKLTFIIISLFLSLISFAGEVTEQEALQKAQKFMKGKQFKQKNLRRAATATKNAYYVFNVENNGGFVIVAGDDRTREILGYSEHGNIDMKHIPCNMKWWLESYAQQIATLGSYQKPAASAVNRTQRAAVAPLITAKWNQDSPYYNWCPDGNYVDYDEEGYNTERRCLTGCVATAMAQLMYYWKWPKTCPALDSYEIDGHTIKSLPATSFKWEQMKDTYNGDETGDDAVAVAELMRYCAQAVKTSYSLWSSSANLNTSIMISTFQYSSDMKEISRDGYTSSQWDSFMYEELVAKRPVLYSGYTPNGNGHQFIIDGYDGAGLFHINWGWGGYPDTYFALSVTEGSEAPVMEYQVLQTALIGVEPSKVVEETIIVDNVAYLCNPYKKTAKVIASDDVDNEVSSVTIQQTVKASGVDCKVIAISDMAFNGWSCIKEVVIPEGVESIGSSAFRWCFRLQKVVLPSTLTYIGGKAFDGVDVINVVESHNPDPQDINQFSFFGNSNYNPVTGEFEVESTLAVLYVPVGSKEKYEALSGWKQFRKIEEGEQKEAKVGDLKYWYPSAGSTAIVVPDDSYMTLTTVTIPATVEIENKSYQVKDIGGWAFRRANSLKSISLAEGIEIIGAEALSDIYSLNEITLPQSLKVIGYQAFSGSKIKMLIIPEGVESIYANAFSNMSNLIKLELPNSLKYIGGHVIWETNLTAVVSHITEPFATYDFTFNYSYNSPSPATLFVPAGSKAKYEALSGWTQFTKIEEGEYKESFVEGLKYSYCTEGTTATLIQDDSYQELTEVTIPPTVNIDGRIYQVTDIGNSAFKGCGNLLTVSLPEGIKIMGAYSFNNSGLTEITLPHSLLQIGEYAFSDCSSIKKMIVPEGVESVGESAFFRMKNLEILELPNSLRNIGMGLIMSDANLKSVVSHIVEPFPVDNNIFALDMTWGDQGAGFIPSTATLYVPAGTKEKYEALSGWTLFADIVEMQGIDPVTEEEVSFSDIINEETDLSNTVIENTYYNLDEENGDGYDATTQALVLNSTTTTEQMNAIRDAEVGSVAISDNFNGIIFELSPGKGTVTIDAQTIGTHVLMVQIGNNAPTEVTKSERGTVDVPFDVKEPVYVYLYASTADGSAARIDRAPVVGENSLLLYGYKLTIGPTSIKGDVNGDGLVNVTDIVATVNYIMEKPSDDFNEEAADLNGDGLVNVTDIVMMVKIIMEAAAREMEDKG